MGRPNEPKPADRFFDPPAIDDEGESPDTDAEDDDWLDDASPEASAAADLLDELTDEDWEAEELESEHEFDRDWRGQWDSDGPDY